MPPDSYTEDHSGADPKMESWAICGFVVFKKAFDSADREVLWKILRHYGVPEKIVKMKRVFCDTSKQEYCIKVI